MPPEPPPLGLPSALSVDEARSLATAIETLWEATMGRVRDLDSDLRALKRYFDPVASGKRLRTALSSLPAAPRESLRLGPPHVIVIDEEHLLPTPEGRVALDLLRRQLLTESAVIAFTAEALAQGLQRLLEVYRSWSRHRLDQTLALLAGAAEPLRLPAVGLLLTLLANRNLGRDRAMPVSDATTRTVVEPALLEPAGAFAQALGAERLHIQKESLYRGWMLHEVSRRLPSALVSGEIVYIVEAEEDAARDLAARELARREVDATAVARAFDALLDALRSHLSTLAAHKLAFERAPDSRRLREDLIARFELHMDRLQRREITGAV